jgi:hypothetical protein
MQQKNLHRPYADGGTKKGDKQGESNLLTPLINSCKPDTKKRKPPATGALSCWGRKTMAGP